MTPCHLVRYLSHRYQYISFFCVLPFDLLRDIQPFLWAVPDFKNLALLFSFYWGFVKERQHVMTCRQQSSMLSSDGFCWVFQGLKLRS